MESMRQTQGSRANRRRRRSVSGRAGMHHLLAPIEWSCANDRAVGHESDVDVFVLAAASFKFGDVDGRLYLEGYSYVCVLDW